LTGQPEYELSGNKDLQSLLHPVLSVRQQLLRIPANKLQQILTALE
jgi:hypothetical protein